MCTHSRIAMLAMLVESFYWLCYFDVGWHFLILIILFLAPFFNFSNVLDLFLKFSLARLWWELFLTTFLWQLCAFKFSFMTDDKCSELVTKRSFALCVEILFYTPFCFCNFFYWNLSKSFMWQKKINGPDEALGGFSGINLMMKG